MAEQVRLDLVALALFLSPVWEEDNADDVASAKQAVNDFLASRGLAQGKTFEGRLDVTDSYSSVGMRLVPSHSPSSPEPAPEVLDLLEELAEFAGRHIRITVEILR